MRHDRSRPVVSGWEIHPRPGKPPPRPLYDHIHLIDVESHDVTTFGDRDMTPYWAWYAGDGSGAINVENQRTLSTGSPTTTTGSGLPL